MRLVWFCLLLVLLVPTFANATTYYIRDDGGTPTRCTGTTDAADPGSGSDQPCAWKYLFYATGVQANAAQFPQRISGSDIVVVKHGDNPVGHVVGVFDTNNCDSTHTRDCWTASLPSGTSENPTRIVGDGWDAGCSSKPELYGVFGTDYIIRSDGADYIDIQCLEITDHASCIDHGGHATAQCDDSYGAAVPFAWAGVRLFNTTGSSMTNVNVHGIANNGILISDLYGFTATDVTSSGNGLSGISTDLEGDDDSTGTISFTNLTIEWNGCIETYPGLLPAECSPIYGDGFGAGRTNSGNWVFTNATFRYNTSDGLDVIYFLDPATVTIEGGLFEGNSGNQIKTGGATQIIRNAVVVGNCNYFNTGEPGNQYIAAAEWAGGDFCRAAGDAIIPVMSRVEDSGGHDVYMANVSISNVGNYGVWFGESSGTCDNSETAILRNIIIRSDGVGTSTIGTNCGDLGTDWDLDYFVVYDSSENCTSLGISTCFDGDPLFSTFDLANGVFDFLIQSGSPARDTGLAAGQAVGTTTVPSDDYRSLTRDANVDIGAYEFGASSPTPQAAFSGIGGSGWTVQ